VVGTGETRPLDSLLLRWTPIFGPNGRGDKVEPAAMAWLFKPVAEECAMRKSTLKDVEAKVVETPRLGMMIHEAVREAI
jgi:hypothetical protein